VDYLSDSGGKKKPRHNQLIYSDMEKCNEIGSGLFVMLLAFLMIRRKEYF